MKCTTHFFSINFFLINLFTTVLSLCGSEIQNKSSAISYPVSSTSIIYNGSINECGCSNENICIRKCCDINFIMHNETCVFNNTTKLKVPIYKTNGGDLIKENSVNISFVPGMLKCIADKHQHLTLYPERAITHNLSVQSDGQLWVPILNVLFNQNEYCLEYTEEYGLIGFVCPEVPEPTFSDRLSSIGRAVSLPFLLITFIVYALLPERNLHGKCLMCYVFALFVGYFTLVFVYFYDGDWAYPFVSCKAVGMTALFSLMSTIFWANVMSFDICSTFSGSRGYSRNRKQEERNRFLMYSCYAWGIPLLFIAVIFTLSYTVRPNVWYDPGVRGLQCMLRDGIPMLLYFYGPIAILTLANIIMFIVTAWKIKKIQKDTAMLMKKESKKHGSDDNDNKKRFHLYIKLLFAMGINWSMEIINFAVTWQIKDVPPAVWYLTDLCNALYGVAIFFLFVYKKNIWKALKTRYYKTMGTEQPESSTTRSSLVKR